MFSGKGKAESNGSGEFDQWALTGWIGANWEAQQTSVSSRNPGCVYHFTLNTVTLTLLPTVKVLNALSVLFPQLRGVDPGSLGNPNSALYSQTPPLFASTFSPSSS